MFLMSLQEYLQYVLVQFTLRSVFLLIFQGFPQEKYEYKKIRDQQKYSTSSFSFEKIFFFNANPMHYYALRVPRKVDRWR